MTEREIRLCIAGTVSEAQLRMAKVGYAHGDADMLLDTVIAAIDELMRARTYAEQLVNLKNTVS